MLRVDIKIMQHIIILFYTICTMLGFGSILLYSVVYFKSGYPVIKRFLHLQIFATAYLVIALFRIYLVANVFINLYLQIASFLLYYAWFPFFIYSVPAFFHELVEKKFTLPWKAFFIAVGALFPVMMAVTFSMYELEENIYYRLVTQFRYAGGSAFIFTSAYCIFIMTRAYSSITNRQTLFLIRYFIITTAVFIPGFIYDVAASSNLRSMEMSNVIFIRVYFLVWSLSSIVLLFTYLVRKVSFGREEVHLAQEFVKKFSITRREEEIIGLLLKNNTYSKIGERLFISPKTVERHVSNIYRKSRVASRDEFVSLMASYT